MKKLIFYFCILLIFNIPVYGDESLIEIKQQLKRIERNISDLQKELYAKKETSNSLDINTANNNSEITIFDMRLRDIERELKEMHLNYENLSFDIEDINKVLNDLSLQLSDTIIKINSKMDNNLNEVSSNDKPEEGTLGTITISSNDLSEGKNEDLSEDLLLEKKIVYASPEEQYQEAFDYLRTQRLEEAESALKEFIKDNSEHKFSGSAHYWLGEIYLLRKEYREAALIFAEGYQKHPDSVKSPDSLYKLAEALIKIEKTQEACNTLNQFLIKFPENKLADKIKLNITNLQCS